VIDMGLLEKAGQIDSTKADDPVLEKPVEPEPVAAVPVPETKAKPTRKKRERRKRAPRARKTRQKKELPDGFEPATKGQVAVRRVSDFVVSWGWCVPLVVVSAWGSYFDPTYFVVLGLLLIGFNLSFMPYSTGRTVGNWVSRTTYVTSKSDRPHQSYILFKGLTFPLVLIGLMLILTATSEGLKETKGQILLASGLILVIPPFLDYIFYRIKSDNLGLWDTLYGGVWMVRTTKTAEAKGWLKRLEQLGDYSESQGWWKDKEDESPEVTE